MEINANNKLPYWDSNLGLLERESGSKPTEPLMSSSMAQLVCCLTHVLRGPGLNPSHGSLLFAFQFVLIDYTS